MSTSFIAEFNHVFTTGAVKVFGLVRFHSFVHSLLQMGNFERLIWLQVKGMINAKIQLDDPLFTVSVS